MTLVIGVARTTGLGSPLAIPIGVLAYGLALIASAIGVVLHRRWGWPLAIVVVAAGIALLVVLLAVVGFDDAVLLGGLIIWAITLAALLASRARPAG